jgi:hypothetical protein
VPQEHQRGNTGTDTVDFRAVATGTVRLCRHVLDMGIRGGLCIESGAQQSLQGTVTAGFFGIDLAEFKHTFSTKDLFKDTGDCSE